MRNTLGNLTATVSVRIGDGDPADIATIDIPITVSPTFTGADIVVDRKQTNRNLADALHAAAYKLAPDVHPAQYLSDDADSAQRAAPRRRTADAPPREDHRREAPRQDGDAHHRR